jgi:uncharacterized sodium:solute symporter family permease YidK
MTSFREELLKSVTERYEIEIFDDIDDIQRLEKEIIETNQKVDNIISIRTVLETV